MRRFRILTDDKNKKDKLVQVILEKSLSREDLILIITSIGLNFDIVGEHLKEEF